jgi:hypothetical protein
MTMRRLTLAALIAMVLLPFIVLLASDFRYNQVISGLCRANESIAPACDYPERYSREAVVTTAFYRHLRTYMGGEKGTSWSFTDHMASLENDNDTKTWVAAHEAMGKIRQFNVYFVLSVGLSLVVASSAATILIQRLAHGHRLRRNHT